MAGAGTRHLGWVKLPELRVALLVSALAVLTGAAPSSLSLAWDREGMALAGVEVARVELGSSPGVSTVP